MYIVIEYNNYRKEQDFEIKLAFNNVKKNDIKKSFHKITTSIEKHHLYPKNKRIIE